MKRTIYFIFIFFILLMSWDLSKQDLALASSPNMIPDEAIRLRIIANSDSNEDQWLKRKVRDNVTEEINKWVKSLDTIKDARQIIEEHLPELTQIVKETVQTNGFDYQDDVIVELGVVPFPTKMYGDVVYPAGEYEALRITLGEGLGQNWWCVLFPPLCFVDMSTGDAVTIDSTEKDETMSETAITVNDQNIEVRFFVVDMFQKIINFLKSLF